MGMVSDMSDVAGMSAGSYRKERRRVVEGEK